MDWVFEKFGFVDSGVEGLEVGLGDVVVVGGGLLG